MLLRYLTFLLLLSGATCAIAQERCGTVEYEMQLLKKHPKKESTQQFEQWMNTKLSRPKNIPQSNQRTQNTYTIPVVVHVIHNGEPVGTGINISDAQIKSQLDVLNNDFNRLNADKINTPAVFQPLGGSFDVQFVMAKQDPNGLATNGIVRVKGSQVSWTYNDDYLLKSQSYWAAEQYLNIWVTNITDYLGYTQLPVSNLPGLEGSSNERLTDGIVVNYQAFGSNDVGNFDLKTKYNKGRTLTHEMGHFFGLRHIWGDQSGCTGTDYVSDTPTQSKSTSGCPAHPQTDCTTIKMFQNYLDYTDDTCMNILTVGQVDRMNIVIQNSPRRMELPSSIGSQPPSSIANDLGIKTILSPGTSACSGMLTPSILVRNYGTNPITSAQLQLKRNNVIIETKNIALSLAINAEVQVNFLPVPLNTSTTSQFDFQLIQTNNVTDGNSVNNNKGVITTVPANANLPIGENFSTFPTNWSVDNPDQLITWKTTTAGGSPSVYLNYYDYKQIGSVDRLITPVINLTTATKVTLLFDRAYAVASGFDNERLRIVASSTCQFDNSSTVIFDRYDMNLATTKSSCSFAPGSSHWYTETISLNQFIGQSVQLAFEGTNGNGNNLYLTNIKIFEGDYTDLQLVNLVSPSPVSCSSNKPLKIQIQNKGNVTINSFTASTKLNNGNTQTQLFSGLTLVPGYYQEVELNTSALSVGANQVSISLDQPNGIIDSNPINNQQIYNLVINNAKDILPLREKFDTNSQQNWSIVSQGQKVAWAKATTNYSQSLFYNAYSYTDLGATSWLVSPTMDFSNLQMASVFFDVSYARRSTGCETVKLLVSTDCGITFTDTIFDQTGSQLAITNSENKWTPAVSADWKKNFVDFTNYYVGQPNVRFAFVISNGNGNNLYLDNIEFFANNNPSPLAVQNPFAVYGGLGTPVTLTFNLEERETVELRIFNSMGQMVSARTLPDMLNQTYSLDLSEHGKGIYILQLRIGALVNSQKVYLGD